jgi:hypothetical protein
VLGLVLGPGEVLGVGLVVLGVSVPMPPAAESPEVSPDMPEELSEGMSDGMSDDELPPEVDLDGSDGISSALPSEVLPPDAPDVPVSLVSEGMPEVPSELVPVLLVPELLPMPESEPPSVMPAHAPSSIAQAIGNIHFVINHSRKFR